MRKRRLLAAVLALTLVGNSGLPVHAAGVCINGANITGSCNSSANNSLGGCQTGNCAGVNGGNGVAVVIGNGNCSLGGDSLSSVLNNNCAGTGGNCQIVIGGNCQNDDAVKGAADAAKAGAGSSCGDISGTVQGAKDSSNCSANKELAAKILQQYVNGSCVSDYVGSADDCSRADTVVQGAQTNNNCTKVQPETNASSGCPVTDIVRQAVESAAVNTAKQSQTSQSPACGAAQNNTGSQPKAVSQGQSTGCETAKNNADCQTKAAAQGQSTGCEAAKNNADCQAKTATQGQSTGCETAQSNAGSQTKAATPGQSTGCKAAKSNANCQSKTADCAKNNPVVQGLIQQASDCTGANVARQIIINQAAGCVTAQSRQSCQQAEQINTQKTSEQSTTEQPNAELPVNQEQQIPELPETTEQETVQPTTEQQIAQEQPDTAAYDAGSAQGQVLNLVNQNRAAAGLHCLRLDADLCAAAQIRAQEIMTSFSHTRPDGRKFSTVLTDNGIRFTAAGENIAWGQTSPTQVMNAWMNSDGHRANIMNQTYTKLGVGHLTDANGRQYWVQLFSY